MLGSNRIPMPYFRQAGVCAAVVWAIAELAPYAIASDGLPLAIDFIQKRDWKNAERALDQALGQSPEDLQALYWKSYVLFQTGDYQQSSTYATRYLERNPANGDAHKILGLDYFMQGQPVLAETELRRASGPVGVEERKNAPGIAEVHTRIEEFPNRANLCQTCGARGCGGSA